MSCLAGAQNAARSKNDIPRLVHENGRHALLVDGAPYLVLGAQVNNSSAWPAMLPKVWPAIEYLHANTVEMPVYWEQFEPEPGRFDYSVLDTLLAQTRAHHLHLVVLWFGTWKNGSSHYMPEWMKRSPERYPLLTGANGRPVDSPSPFATEALQADMRAFTALMRHLKAADPEHTVIMVQVENEPGTWGSVRDYSAAAQKAFEAPVPRELLTALHKEVAPSTNWSAVFGDDAEEFFHAWSVARYIEQVAAAGKAVYPLPLYVNAALRDPLHPSRPPSYESGGPTDNVIPIWKAAAPSIDLLAPDIYLNEGAPYLKVLELYGRPDNALFVPESRNIPAYSRYFFAALGDGAIGFSPFGMDFTGYVNSPLGTTKVTEETLEPYALNYKLVGPMARELARLNFEGKVQAVAEEKGQPSQCARLWSVDGDGVVRAGTVWSRGKSAGESRACWAGAGGTAWGQSVSGGGIVLPRRFSGERCGLGEASGVFARRRGNVRERSVPAESDLEWGSDGLGIELYIGAASAEGFAGDVLGVLCAEWCHPTEPVS